MADENEDILQKLAPSIVEIISDDKEGEEASPTLGTGFVVTDDGLIITCRHVIADSQDKLMNSVKVRFHSDSKTDVKLRASLVKQDQDIKSDPSIDIAFLKLVNLPEKGVTPVRLDDKVVSLNEFATIGFRKAHEFSGLIAQGSIGILTHMKISDDFLSPEVIQLFHKKQIEPGMSGAPVFDTKRNKVVGIITERYKPTDFTDEDTLAFALPVKSMIELCPLLRERNQGLTLLSKFLNALGEKVESSIYKRIDEVYAPPNEYEEIKGSLKRERIVFITGTKEFGKTFTAVRLLYEYFKEGGYKPRWIHERKEQEGHPGGSDPQELARVRLEEDYIKPHEIVYFEDPFGKTKYESYSELENYIRSIIHSIKSIEDAYVIITSREEVFKEFEREKFSDIELGKLEKKMNLKRASYSIEKKKDMLYRWAKVYNCKWLLNSVLTNLVLEAVENQETLPTPLNVKDFVIASHDVLDSEQLKDLMRQESQETARRFAEEIMSMKEDEKILFLAFPYVGRGSLDAEFVKKIYEFIIVDWRESSQKHYRDFERVKRWFEGDKINISDNRILFSHPSYYEAFDYAIDSEKDDGSRIRNIFVKVLEKLVNENKALRYLANTIADNFNSLPAHIQQLLFKIADNDKAPWGVAEAIQRNFNQLPSNIRDQLLLNLAENKDTARWVVEPIVSNYLNLTNNVRNILFKLAQNKETAKSVAKPIVRSIATNFDKLPDDVREGILYKLADKDDTYMEVAKEIADHIRLPQNVENELLKKLMNRADLAPVLVERIIRHFDKLDENMRDEWLLKLADNNYAAVEIAKALDLSDPKLREAKLVSYSYLFDEYRFFNPRRNIKNELLLKLADNEEAAKYIVYVIVRDFNRLPHNIKKMLFDFAANKRVLLNLAEAIMYHFNDVPRDVKTLLFKLADDRYAAKFVAEALIETLIETLRFRFNELPDNVRNELLLKLVDNAEAARYFSYTLENNNIFNLPDNVRNELARSMKK